MPRSPEKAAGLADGPTILVISDQRDWHARQMDAAFAAAGARVERIDLADCGFDTCSPSGLSLPVLGSQLPDAVHVRTLSAGQRRRAALARVAASGAPLWLLDEPLNALDAPAQLSLRGAIAQHLAAGGMAIAATHAPLEGARVLELA